VLLDERRHDPCGTLFVVYDHPKPSPRVKVVLAIETLTARLGVILTMIWERHGADDRVDSVDQIGPAALEVFPSALVIDDLSTIRIHRPGNWRIGHPAAGMGVPPSARVKRAANSPAGRACR
jgi:hypothetical protein